VVLCKHEVEAPLALIRRVLERLGLELNEAKTSIVNAREASFNFLGFAIRMSRGLRTGKPYPHVCPSAKALARIKTRVTELTGRERTVLPLEIVVGEVNRTLRGWANYFHYGNSTRALEKLKTHAEERLRKRLMKRHKVKDRGIGAGRFPRRDLYARYGLYRVPTRAGWRSAHAST
jgi:RNA-directed DNA polymerase